MPEHISGIVLSLFLSLNLLSVMLIASDLFLPLINVIYVYGITAASFVFFNFFYVKLFIRNKTYQRVLEEYGKKKWADSWKGNFLVSLYVIVSIVLLFLA